MNTTHNPFHVVTFDDRAQQLIQALNQIASELRDIRRELHRLSGGQS